MRQWWIAIIVGLAAGCPDAELGLTVDLKTDFVPGIEFAAVHVQIFRGPPSPGADPLATDDRPALLTDDFTTGRRIVERTVDRGEHWVQVRLVAADGSPRAEQTTSVRIVGSQHVVIVIARSCPYGGCAECVRAEDCEMRAACAERQCDEGACLYTTAAGACPMGQWCNAEVGCLDLDVIPDAGPPPPDAGPRLHDAGPRPRDAGPSCTPDCSGRSCGGDGCRGSCGSCSGVQTCDEGSGTCVDPPPDCSGLSCGPARNGVGGPDACGTCGTGFTCSGGACQCGGNGSTGCVMGSCCSPNVCSGGECCLAVGMGCGSSDECCPARLCQMGVCCVVLRDPCGSPDQCCNGHNCVAGRCCVRLGVGCSMDDQCCSGTCAGTCV